MTDHISSQGTAPDSSAQHSAGEDRPRLTIHVEPVTFWFVWTKTGHIPRKAHQSRAAAEAEAVRLASLCPGKKFIVLEAQTKLHAEPDTEAAAPVAETVQP